MFRSGSNSPLSGCASPRPRSPYTKLSGAKLRQMLEVSQNTMLRDRIPSMTEEIKESSGESTTESDNNAFLSKLEHSLKKDEYMYPKMGKCSSKVSDMRKAKSVEIDSMPDSDNDFSRSMSKSASQNELLADIVHGKLRQRTNSNRRSKHNKISTKGNRLFNLRVEPDSAVESDDDRLFSPTKLSLKNTVRDADRFLPDTGKLYCYVLLFEYLFYFIF